MSVVSVERKVADGINESGADGSLTLNYSVNLSSKNDGGPTALASTLLPQYGHSLLLWEPGWPNAGRFKCITRTPTTFPRNPKWVDVACVFSTVFGEATDTNPPGHGTGSSPLDKGSIATSRRPKVSSSNRDIEIPFYTDDSGALIKNTAGDQFQPPLMTTVRQTIYTIAWSEASIPAWVYTEKKYTNSVKFTIRGKTWAKDTLLIDSVSASEELEENAETFNNVTATVIGDKRTHNRKVLNEGLWHLPLGDSGNWVLQKRRCRINGVDADQPQPLASDGRQIDPADLKADPINTPHYLSLSEFESVSFSSYLPSVS